MGEMLYRSPAYCGALLQRLKQLYDKGQFCDFSLLVGNVEVKIHSAVLFSASNYFKLLMDDHGLQENHFNLQTSSIDCLQVLINFMYTGCMTLSQDNIWAILTLSIQLDIPEAIELCQQFLKDTSTKFPLVEPQGSQSSGGHQGAALPTDPDQSSGGHQGATLPTDPDLKSENGVEPDESDGDQIPNSCSTTAEIKEEMVECCAENEAVCDVEVSYVLRSGQGRSRRRESERTTKGQKQKRGKALCKLVTNDDDKPRSGITPCRRGRPKGSKNKIKTPRKQPKRTSTENSFENNNLENKVDSTKMLSCEICFEEFQLCSLLKQHQMSHFSSWYRFQQVKQMIRSAMSNGKNNQNVGRNVCSSCSKACDNYLSLKVHMLKKHADLVFKFNCRHCSQKAFRSRKNLALHKLIHHRNTESFRRRHFCTGCGWKFLHRSTLTNHKQSCSGNIKRQIQAKKNEQSQKCNQPMSIRIWKCQEEGCDIVVGNRAVLLQHMVDSHPEVDYSCPMCVFSTPLKSALENHQRRYHTSSGPCVCEMCGQKYNFPYRLKLHMFSKHKVKHPEVKLYECPMNDCDYVCVYRGSLKTHMLKHEPAKQVMCQQCGRYFKNQKNVEKHTAKVHLGIRNYVCDMCGASYGDEAELKMHIIRHGDTKGFHCDHCSYSSYDKGNYKIHLYLKHRINENMKVYHCDSCEFSTVIKKQYVDHMRVHKGIRDIKCTHCEKLYLTRKAMLAHIVRVHRSKDHRCPHCAFCTAIKGKLDHHIHRVHTHHHVKPYQCPYCALAFGTGFNCREHVKNIHKGQDVRYIKLAITEESTSTDEQKMTQKHNAKPHKDNGNSQLMVNSDSLENHSIMAHMISPSSFGTPGLSVNDSLQSLNASRYPESLYNLNTYG